MCFPWREISRALLIAASLSMLGGWPNHAVAQNSPDPSMLDTGDAKPEVHEQWICSSPQRHVPPNSRSTPATLRTSAASTTSWTSSLSETKSACSTSPSNAVVVEEAPEHGGPALRHHGTGTYRTAWTKHERGSGNHTLRKAEGGLRPQGIMDEGTILQA